MIDRRRRPVGLCALLVAASATTLAGAHVTLDEPNGGEEFVAATVVLVQWHVVIQHDTLDWDLWYSTESADGPWIELATDLPAGDVAAGAEHAFAWTAPRLDDTTVWILVRQDNRGTDYEHVSDGPFSIVTDNCPADLAGPAGGADGNVDALDLLLLVEQWGTTGPEADFTGPDGGPDGIVDSIDFLALIAQWGAPGNCPVP